MLFKVNGKKYVEFPNFLWHYEGRYLMRLKALEMETSPVVNVYPQYRQAFDLFRSAGQIDLTFYIGASIAVRFILQKRWPFIHISFFEQEIGVNDSQMPH
jgi:hypothetical protein